MWEWDVPGVRHKVASRAAGPLHLAIGFLAVALLAGCAGRPGPDALTANEASAPGTSEHVILVASTRARDPRPGTFYNGERSPALSFARIDMTVPPDHKPGEVEWPKQAPGNPATDMVVRDAVYRDTPQQFDADLSAQLALRPPGQKKVVIFIHGYNTQFSEALYRLAQMAEDSRSTAVPVLFTWASRGETADYVYDTNSATAARDRLEDTIRLVFASGAEQVSILAHSMGNWVTVEALRQIRISGRGVPPQKVGNIILAAPDIDVDVFKSQLKRFGKPAKPFIVVVSADDKALGFSEFIAGGKGRLGSYTNDTDLVDLGAVVVDMTKVKALDSFNHGKFAQLAAIAPELQMLTSKVRSQGAPAKLELDNIQLTGLDRYAPKPASGAKRDPAAAEAEPATETEVARAPQQ